MRMVNSIKRKVRGWLAGGLGTDPVSGAVLGIYSTTGIRNRRPCPRCGLWKKYKHCCGK